MYMARQETSNSTPESHTTSTVISLPPNLLCFVSGDNCKHNFLAIRELPECFDYVRIDCGSSAHRVWLPNQSDAVLSDVGDQRRRRRPWEKARLWDLHLEVSPIFWGNKWGGREGEMVIILRASKVQKKGNPRFKDALCLFYANGSCLEHCLAESYRNTTN